MLLDVFRKGQDVYIDYPFEDVMFRWEYQAHKVFRKFYGQAEVEIDHTSNLFHEAISTGQQITSDQMMTAKPQTLKEILDAIRLSDRYL